MLVLVGGQGADDSDYGHRQDDGNADHAPWIYLPESLDALDCRDGIPLLLDELCESLPERVFVGRDGRLGQAVVIGLGGMRSLRREGSSGGDSFRGFETGIGGHEPESLLCYNKKRGKNDSIILRFFRKIVNTIVDNSLIKKLPTHPGCYLMKNAEDTVIYVGKAKNIRKRVSSYPQSRDFKTQALVANIADIETIVTDTEVEALILEAQLIGKYHPKYNIDLQSTGRYAYITLTKEPYPRFVIARKISSGAKHYGPFPSAAARNAILKNINRIFRFCTSKQKGRPCSRYHLNLCSGACIGVISQGEYLEQIRQAEKFIKGDYESVMRNVETMMKEAAAQQRFEAAKIYRDQLSALRLLDEQKVSAPKRTDQDVIAYGRSDGEILVELFHFDRGIISGRKEFSFDLDELLVASGTEALADFIHRYYSGAGKIPHEVVIPEKIPDQSALQDYLTHIAGRSVIITVPQKGIKKKLIELVRKNIAAKLGDGGGRLSELQRVIRLKTVPRTIACIDISHLAGTQNVGSLVVFANGQPKKSAYRKFIGKTVEGSNDTAMIAEIVTRYGTRILDGKEDAPDLLVIDGGRGQLNSAMRALSRLSLAVPAIGLAKRLEEIYVPWVRTPLRLPQKSSALQLLRAIRDEAHRFAVSFQRKRRSGRR